MRKLSASEAAELLTKIGCERTKAVKPDEEEIKEVASCVQITQGETKQYGKGNLYISTSRVIWTYFDEGQEIFNELLYPKILMHAICRDTESYNLPCIYLQLDEDDDSKRSENAEADNPQDVYEIRFAPKDPSLLDALFASFSFCASLHPDMDEDFTPISVLGNESNENSYESVLTHLDNVLTVSNSIDEERYADAEESDYEDS
mmetsp:Transcript_5177/g.5901  ORF Transcript_5177/g.5901 Transcript_5177/m.5901 type:complete len:204 (-) Transcript_5177:1228-1839(-)|eukprot:CAMPEP_0184022134 /NCGR_PEP_ID=MMETSP0954-20121128/10405_1 /TAXON_ID=627963 /ORGANISM="Aplanochytrium sp, Strain PBS07" /LENGTH=203 /DNA_ID=CAMNT_0026304411 /DNA_START=2100 /DNA_END=2711 /DNA_ORIENTATION=-